MPATPLILGATQKAQLGTLRAYAVANPIDVLEVREQVKTEAGKAAHIKRMMRHFTAKIPAAFMVTFSIETGHGSGVCRHLSVSVLRRGRTPTPEAVWLLAELMGFQGGLEACAIWEEGIGAGDVAINVVQPVALDVSTMKVMQ
jgi:hypothetical protein